MTQARVSLVTVAAGRAAAGRAGMPPWQPGPLAAAGPQGSESGPGLRVASEPRAGSCPAAGWDCVPAAGSVKTGRGVTGTAGGLRLESRRARLSQCH